MPSSSGVTLELLPALQEGRRELGGLPPPGHRGAQVPIEVVPRGLGRQRGDDEPPAAVVQRGVDDQPRAVPARLPPGQVAERGGSQQALGHDLGEGARRQRRVEPAEGEQLAPEEGAFEVLAQFLLVYSAKNV